MALKTYIHKKTGETKRSLKKLDEEIWEVKIEAPNQKYMITSDGFLGKSKLKDSEGILRARARNHSRDVLGDDTISANLEMGSTESVARNLLNEKGERRRKIDDV